ncbi:hypothetical protein [Flavobacterium sp.]
MKKIILLALVFLANHSVGYAQKSYNFDYKLHPNKTYVLQMDITSTNETTIDGKMTKSESVSKVSRSTTTKAANAAGLFPAIMTFDEAYILNDGKEMTSPISNTVIEGLMAADNKFQIDTIINSKMDKTVRDALKIVFKDLKPEIEFPKKALKIGETFSHDVPITIPVNGQTIKIIITKNYTLKSVLKNLAEFSVSEDFRLEAPSENSTAIGDGTGSVVFDILENQVIKDNTRLTINVKIKTAHGMILGYMNSNSKKTTVIK